MQPRGKLDIGWSDLFFGIRRCLRPGERRAAQRRTEQRWSPHGDALACLSVRSGFDALLRALAYPSGDEVLVSAITIRDMIHIIEHHGLVPVPVDLDMAALSLSLESLERSLTPRARAVLVAHVFGSRMPLDDVIACARRHGLLVIEDCAQAFAGTGYRGHPESDVVMFSFGPIKTNTALAGGILTFTNPELRERVRSIQNDYQVQSRRTYLTRLVKFAGIKILAVPRVFSLFGALCRLAGKSHDDVISAALRGFPGPDLFTRLRQQPSAPLLALLERRLTTFDPGRIERRKAVAEAAIALMPSVARPGRRARVHTHWVFPVQTPTADRLMHSLWNEGFDATRGASSLYVVDPPPDRPELAPTEARTAMRDLLYLPVYPGVANRDLERLARITECYAAEAAIIPPATGGTSAGVPNTGGALATPVTTIAAPSAADAIR